MTGEMPMKAAVIGGGFAGRTHVKALRAIGVEPEVVITYHKEKAERFAEELAIPHWSAAETDGYEAAFAPEIDAVHICTPPVSHGRIAKEMLSHGKHLLCEKPVSLDAKEAAELAAAAENSGLVTAVTFNVRFHMAMQRAREILSSGVLGRPLLIHGSYLQEFHALPAPPDWRYDPALGGSMRAVTEIGTHWIDLAQYLTGLPVIAVSSQFAGFWKERVIRDGLMYPAGAEQTAEITGAGSSAAMHVESEDAAVLNLRFGSGAIGAVVLSEISPGRGNRLAIEITCENGNLWWNEEENNILYTARKGDGIRSELFAFGNGFGDTFETLLEKFYASVKARKDGSQEAAPDLPTFTEGASVSAVCAAAKASADRDGIWIPV